MLVIVLLMSNIIQTRPQLFSAKSLLSSVWQDYKNQYVEAASGRVINKQQSNVTTSEGISYTMLRAVWSDDKVAFDQTLSWAQKNLQRPDSLFSWEYGTKTNGTQGILTDQGGQNSATDGDVNIALALIFASKRWSDPTYMSTATPILNSIWSKEVVTVAGVPYVSADDIERLSKTRVVINPSYFEPYAYRIFASMDKTHNWMALVDSSYALLEISTKSSLDQTSSGNLPPDWITLNRLTGDIVPNEGTLTTNFSYDALRVPWNIALDYEWFKDPRAKSYLDNLKILSAYWNTDKKLYSVYKHDGTTSSFTETPAMYAGSIGYFMWSDPKVGAEIYKDKLSSLFNPDINSWKQPLSYYDDNWVWFGIALYSHHLPNLSEN